MRLFHNVRGRIAGLAFSADGKALFACVRGKWDVAVWNRETGPFRLSDPGADNPVRSLAASPDGRCVAVGDQVGRILAYRYPELVDFEDFSFGGTARPWVEALAFGWTADRAECRMA